MGCPSFLRHPHSNQRAELGVKQPKRIIRENVDGSGILSTNRFSRAITNYRNTPCRDLKMSPAQILFNRQLTAHLPIPPGKYRPRGEWILTKERRELALAMRSTRQETVLSEHTNVLLPLVKETHSG